MPVLVRSSALCHEQVRENFLAQIIGKLNAPTPKCLLCCLQGGGVVYCIS